MAAAAAALMLLALTAAAAAGASAATAAAATPTGTQAVAPSAAGMSTQTAAAGTLWAWGSNSQGELGNGTTAESGNPVRVRLPKGTKVTSVRAGCDASLALTTTGKVLAWGANTVGQLGNGTTVASHTPVRVKIPEQTKITAVRAGCSFGLALTSAGHVLAWGYGKDGELGNGSTGNRHRPVGVKLPAGIRVKAISAGSGQSFALTTTGRLYAWGANGGGQLGDGTTAGRTRPVRVKLPKGTEVKIASAGGADGLALTTSGQLYAWGHNAYGELGDGTTTGRKTPVKINLSVPGPPIGKITSLFAGCFHSLALTSRGKVLAWGLNTNGQLGDGTTTERTTAVLTQLPAGTAVTAISAGCDYSLARTASGRVLAWGANGQGELGDGTTTDRDTPVMVLLATSLKAIAIGSGPAGNDGFALIR